MATATSVNKPVDVKQKDADVARKLQVYGIISAFQYGKYPSNDQIDVALNRFLASKALTSPSEKISPEGRALVADFRDVVRKAQHLILSKNAGNLLQDFGWQTSHFDPKSIHAPGAPVDKETAKVHGDRAAEGLRTLGRLIITNGQFRKLLKDATIIIRDMAGDAATKAAASVRPSEADLAQVDRPADDNTWHDAPDFSKGNLKKQVQGVYKGSANNKNSNNDAGAALTNGSQAGQKPADAIASTAGASSSVPVDQDRAEELTAEGKEAARAKTQEYRERTKRYLEQKMPRDRRDQAIWRLKKMIIECQQHPDYQHAMQTLLDLAEQYGRHARVLGQEGSGTAKEARSSSLGQAEADLKVMIERFANGTSTDDLWAAIGQIYRDADRDPELRDWFRDTNAYIRRCLKEQGYILDDSSTEEWNHLYDHGNYLLREKYKAHTDRIVDEIKFLIDQFDQDPMNKAFGEAVRKLFNDLDNDENGKPKFKKHLVKDLTDVIIPATFENIAYVPVPRIEFSDHKVDAVIENLVLESDNFTPNLLDVHSENYMRWGRKKITSKSKHSAEVRVSGIQMDLRDVSYYVKRKRGFPSLTDTGRADIFMGGDGFSFKLKISTPDEKDVQKFFRVDKVDVDVKNLKIKLHESKHKLLFSIAQPLLLKVMRPALQKAMGKAIRDNFNELDQLLFKLKQEADRGLEQAQSDPENVPNIYSRYASAVQRQILDGKKKAEKVAADKKVNYAVTQNDSMFPDVKLPGGISSKATEYRELALKGDRWESPVFSIGKASKSNDLPAPPQVVRKPHAVASGGPSQSSSAGGQQSLAQPGIQSM